jgi:O-antigen/teichoic acid export membrane protein
MVYWSTIFRNIVSNWAGYFLSCAVSFMLAPFLVHALGKTSYGLWTLVLSLTGYFGLLDLGIRSSVGRFVARYIALNDTINTNRTINTALAILTAGGLLALCSTWVLVEFFFHRFQIDPELESTGKIALLLLGTNVSCMLPMGIFSSLLIAVERYDLLNTITVIGEGARALLVVFAVKAGYGLVTLAAITLCVSFTQYLAILLLVRANYPSLEIGRRFLDRATFKALVSFGGYRFIWIVSNQLIFYSDSLIIGMFLGAQAITYFAIAGSLMNTGRNVVSLVTDTLTPSAARMDAVENTAGLKRLLILGTRMALLIALPLCLGFIFLGEQFMTLWMGKEFVYSATILAILTIPQFTSMSQYVSITILSSMARHKVLAYITVVEGIANVGLSILLIQKMGLIGVAWGTVITHLITTAFIIPVYTLRTLGMSPREYLTESYLRPVLCALPVGIVCYVCSTVVTAPTWSIFAMEVAAICGLHCILAFLLCLEPQQRDSVRGRIRRTLKLEVIGA